MTPQVLTIGHSNHSLERFVALLRQHSIGAIADVRSAPYSRVNPAYNREPLQASLKKEGIAYVYLGEELSELEAISKRFQNYLQKPQLL